MIMPQTRCRSTIISIAIGLAVISTSVQSFAKSPPPEVASALQAPKLVSTAEMSFLFWRLFRAELWSNDGAFNWDKSFALSLTYDMEFSADELTDKTITEIDRLTDWSTPALAALRDKLSPCMATVGDGDRFTAVGVSPDKVVLFLNSREQCQLETLDLRRAFFQIWLSDNSQFPTESRRLRGVGN